MHARGVRARRENDDGSEERHTGNVVRRMAFCRQIDEALRDAAARSPGLTVRVLKAAPTSLFRLDVHCGAKVLTRISLEARIRILSGLVSATFHPFAGPLYQPSTKASFTATCTVHGFMRKETSHSPLKTPTIPPALWATTAAPSQRDGSS